MIIINTRQIVQWMEGSQIYQNLVENVRRHRLLQQLRGGGWTSEQYKAFTISLYFTQPAAMFGVCHFLYSSTSYYQKCLHKVEHNIKGKAQIISTFAYITLYKQMWFYFCVSFGLQSKIQIQMNV